MNVVRSLYFFVFYKVMYSILKLFPINKNKMLFISYSGRGFSCNPKSIYDEINKLYPELKKVIVLRNKRTSKLSSELKGATIVKYHSVRFLFELATSKAWISNTHLHHFLKPKQNTIYLQTWHAAGAFKKFGLDIIAERTADKNSWEMDASNWTYLICSSDNIVDIYANAFGIDKNKIYTTGLPRNDIFFDLDRKSVIKNKLYHEYNFPRDKKIILYAPTFRDYEVEHFNLQIDIERMQESLSKEYIFVIKLHPLIKNKVQIDKYAHNFVFDLSDHDDVQDLLLISDILISDYSSVIFDFAITGNPIVFYPYDLEFYEQKLRGFYFEYKNFVPGPIVKTNDELIYILSDYQKLYSEYNSVVKGFGESFNAGFDGKATSRVVDLLSN